MEHQVLIHGLLSARLQRHLAPALYKRLQRESSLPSYLIAQECKRLRRELGIIATFIPAPLVQSQIDRSIPGQAGGEFWQGSLLVAKVSGLTAFAEALAALGKEGAAPLTSTLNQLFSGLVDDLHPYSGGLVGGGLLKWYGDHFSVFFNAEVLGDKHALLAANAALAMRSRVEAFARIETNIGSFSFGLRIGIHSGRFLAAEVGDSDHIELVIGGRATDQGLAALMLANKGEIVVSAATGALLEKATLSNRRQDFALLEYLPRLPSPRAPTYWGWESGAGDLAELQSLITRLDLLRPCLPYGLPNTALDPADGPGASGAFAAATVLCITLAPGNDLLEYAGGNATLAAQLFNAYYARAQAAIHRYGGSIIGVNSTGADTDLVALFGLPEAYEDNALRAVRAALELRGCLVEVNEDVASILAMRDWRSELNDITPALQSLDDAAPGSAHPEHSRRVEGHDKSPRSIHLQHRIGIATGALFAGALTSVYRREYTAIGGTLGLAARLAAAAGADEIWLDPATRRLVERYVTLLELPPLAAEGEAEPIAPSAVGRLYNANFYTPITAQAPLIGRDTELFCLVEEAAGVHQGTGQVVALLGDAGSGKTRLIQELIRRLTFRSGPYGRSLPIFRTLTVECQSYEQRISYAAIRELLRQLVRLQPSSDRRQIYHGLLDRLHIHAPEIYRFAPLLGDLLDLPVEDSALIASLPLEQRHERLHDLILALLRIETQREPLLLVIDDIHWADASSRDLLAWLARDAHTLALLLLLSYRPNALDAEPWRSDERCSVVTLDDLSPEASALLATTLLGAPPAPELTTILEQAQGNPFFIEELIWGLMEQDALQRENGFWRLRAATSEIPLPARIERVIEARLERLDKDDRELVQAAAVVGPRFSQSLLAALVPHQERLPQRLERLERNGLIRRAAHGYLFRHTLLRDITYNSIPYSQRRDFHRRAAARLAEWHELAYGNHLELLARHTLLAEEWAATFRYHLAAGKQARTHHANQEAIALFETALAIAPRVLPPPKEQIVELHERLGYLYGLQSRYQDALDSFDRALTLCQRGQGDAGLEGLIRIHRHIAGIHERQSSYDAAFEWLERGLELSNGEPSQEVTGCLLLGAGVYQRQGKYPQSLEWTARGLRIAEQIGSVRDQAHAYKLLANAYASQGDNVRAVELTERSLRLYTEAQDLQGQAGAHMNLGISLYEMGNWPKARTHYEESTRISSAIGNINEQAAVANNLGDVLQSLGDLDGAIIQYQNAERSLRQSRFGSAVVAMNLGAVYLQLGDLPLASEQFDRSAALFAEADVEGFLPELLRYRAELALAQDDSNTALALCNTSLNHAVRLGARLEEGATRRVLGRVLALRNDLFDAAAALQASLELLREVGSRYEIARTLLEIADLLPLLEQHEQGQQAITQALETFASLGARLDLERTLHIATRWNYRVSS